MAPPALEIEDFPGLELRRDPHANVGAMDMLNVDVTRHPGVICARAGYGSFTTLGTDVAVSLTRYRQPGATNDQLGVLRSNGWMAIYSRTGTLINTDTNASNTAPAATTFGTATNDYLYFGGGSGTSLRRWDGAAGTFTNVAAVTWPTPRALCSTSDNRLAAITAASAGAPYTRVRFSDPGNGDSFGANNYVDLDPGDGEQLTGLARYDNYLIAFKASRFYVFYSTSTDATGQPVFNYRTIDKGVGAIWAPDLNNVDNRPAGRTYAPSRVGVFFLARDGVYLTDGNGLERVSGPLDPWFAKEPVRGFNSSSFSGTFSSACLGVVGEKVYVSPEPYVSNTTFVYDTTAQRWTVYDWNMTAVGPMGFDQYGKIDVALGLLNHTVVYHSPNYTTDAGAAITGRYRTGFIGMPRGSRPDGRSRLHGIAVDCAGAVSVGTAVDDGQLIGTRQATFPTYAYPDIARGIDRRGIFGRNVSIEVSGTGPWAASRIELPAFAH